ncbi:retrotransposon protein, putative, ty1-copia subclass, partial [Tanacetum coccineum]
SLSSKEITPQLSVNYLAILQARLQAKGFKFQAKGSRLQAEGSDVDMTKHGEGRTLLMQKLLVIQLLNHVNVFNSTLSRLVLVDIKFDDEVHALLLLSSLPESWKTSGEYSNYLLSAEDEGRGRKQDRGLKQNRGRSKSKKRASKEKEVHIEVGDYDDALLERFRLRSNKVRLVDDKTLDIAGIQDVVLKTSFGQASETSSERLLKGHQRLGHMSGKGMKIIALKGRIPDLQKSVVGFCETCVLGKQKKADPVTMLPLLMTTVGRAKSMRLHAGHPKMFWEDSINMTTYLINQGPFVPLGFRIPEKEWQGKEVRKAKPDTLKNPKKHWGNGIDVVVLVDSIRAISECFANTTYGFFLGKKVAYPVVANYVRNTWGKYRLVCLIFSSSTGLFSFQISSMDGLDAMLEKGPWFIQNNPLILKKWHPDENLLKEDVNTVPIWVKLHGIPVTAFSKDCLSAIATKLAMPKITRESRYTCNVHVEYEWKPPRCSSCKIFGHIHEECPKNTSAGEKKTVKKPSQTSRGILVGSKMGFKPHTEYRPVLKKSTASSSDNKKKGAEPTTEVSNSNPFDVLNSVDNDVEFVPMGGLLIWKFEDLLTSGQAILVDKAGNPLKKEELLGEYDSEDEVASVDNDMPRSMAYERVGFFTQILLEQWKDSYSKGDYDDDPYDDDMYDGQDLSNELHAICDNLDIHV